MTPGLPVPLSLLDRSRTRVGEDHAAALTTTIERARRAEDLGYRRFWVAEHHAVPGIASGSPPVLLAAIAERTGRIRVGSGGVMLPNHRPLVVAEQFAMLEALHPGRIDLGLGRSLGFTAPVREALGVADYDPDDFSRDISAVQAFLDGAGPVTALPVLGQAPPLFVLATRSGLDIAARAGLPVVAGGPMLTTDPGALHRYRQAFRPSATWPEPYVIISLDIMVAESADRARDLLLPEAWAMVASRISGAFGPLEPIEPIRARDLTTRQRDRIEQHVAGSVHGTAADVAAQLTRLVETTGADEVMATTSTFDRDDLARADAALAALSS